jgi:hypothetical protein
MQRFQHGNFLWRNVHQSVTGHHDCGPDRYKKTATGTKPAARVR